MKEFTVKSSRYNQYVRLFGLLFLFNLPACAPKLIPNTQVPDTAENRDVVEFTEKYRKAVENRDVETLLSLASEKYLDDNGTPSGDDDIDFESLKLKFLTWKEKVLDVRYEMKYRRITYENEKVLVDYTYTASFQVDTGEDKRWSRRLSDNRLVLKRNSEKRTFEILSGM